MLSRRGRPRGPRRLPREKAAITVGFRKEPVVRDFVDDEDVVARGDVELRPARKSTSARGGEYGSVGTNATVEWARKMRWVAAAG